VTGSGVVARSDRSLTSLSPNSIPVAREKGVSAPLSTLSSCSLELHAAWMMFVHLLVHFFRFDEE
jgi:hypothetical protein